MEDRDNNKQHEERKVPSSPAEWLPFIHATIALFTLIGAGIGGMLHFLNAGEGHPEYQLFVFQLVTFVLFVLFFFFTLFVAAGFAIEFGKLERKNTNRKYIKYGTRFFTGMFVLLLLFSAYAMLLTGANFFGEGLREYVSFLKAAQQ